MAKAKDELLKTADVTRILKIDPKTLQRLIASGEFPEPVLIEEGSRDRRWFAEDVQRYLDMLRVRRRDRNKK